MKLLAKFWAWHAARPCEAIIGPGHKYVDLHNGRKFEEFKPTGEFINGEPITTKNYVTINKCTRCGDINRVAYRAIF